MVIIQIPYRNNQEIRMYLLRTRFNQAGHLVILENHRMMPGLMLLKILVILKLTNQESTNANLMLENIMKYEVKKNVLFQSESCERTRDSKSTKSPSKSSKDDASLPISVFISLEKVQGSKRSTFLQGNFSITIKFILSLQKKSMEVPLLAKFTLSQRRTKDGKLVNIFKKVTFYNSKSEMVPTKAEKFIFFYYGLFSGNSLNMRNYGKVRSYCPNIMRITSSATHQLNLRVTL